MKLTETEENDLKYFVDEYRKQCNYSLSNLDYDSLKKAAGIINDSKKNNGRLHVTGIGKPGHLASYVASLITSTGTPAYFLDGTEAVHGSSGQLVAGDVVIGISNSGNTDELIATILCAKDNGCKIIGITGNKNSRLAKESDVVLTADLIRDENPKSRKEEPIEGGPLNRAPRNSILSEMIVLQCLSVLLQSDAAITPQQYVKHHPHGALGKLRETEMQ